MGSLLAGWFSDSLLSKVGKVYRILGECPGKASRMVVDSRGF